MNIFGIVGFKNSGKTGLVERLVQNFTSRGFTVSTIKHAHHDFDIDHAGTDSHRHRTAGAQQVVIGSGNRWALMTELRGAHEPSLAELAAHLTDVDIVLVEGFKRDTHPKIEAFRASAQNQLLAPKDPTILAVAADCAVDVACPVIDLDDTNAISILVLEHFDLL